MTKNVVRGPSDSRMAMPDMQKRPDHRRIPIAKVGVKDISYPIVVMDKNRSIQHTVARVNMYVDLPHQFKGTHMSRFVKSSTGIANRSLWISWRSSWPR